LGQIEISGSTGHMLVFGDRNEDAQPCSRVIAGHQIILINSRLNPEMKKKA